VATADNQVHDRFLRTRLSEVISKPLSTITFATRLNCNCCNDNDDSQDDDHHDSYFGALAEVLFDVMDPRLGNRDRGGRVVRHHDEDDD
jgi:hypothetical protein